VGLKLIGGLSVYTLNRIMIFAQSAHLDSLANGSAAESDADVRRAAYVRRALAAEPVDSAEG
jgi:protein arginine kinase